VQNSQDGGEKSSQDSKFPVQTEWAKAETARWMVHMNTWGFLTQQGKATPLHVGTHSFADGAMGKSSGRIWFYLMGGLPESWDASLTMSQAALGNFSCDNTDPEDPRCAKLTVTGTIKKAVGSDVNIGKAALFARHPQMAHWPENHHFTVYELKISHIWMIDFYGGGGDISRWRYFLAKPNHNVPHFPPHKKTSEPEAEDSKAKIIAAPPPHDQVAARARWLVYHSVWATVGTISVHLNGKPWGNVRSVADGLGKNSTGLPYFYLPTPDPTTLDLRANNHIALAFSEAALVDRIDPKTGSNCGGMDAEDPTCARLTLYGSLREVNTYSAYPKTPNCEVRDIISGREVADFQL